MDQCHGAEVAVVDSRPVDGILGEAQRRRAGAIVLGDKGSYRSKRSALEAAGVTVLDTPSDVGAALKARLGQ